MNCKKHKALALKAAHEAMILLKNENPIFNDPKDDGSLITEAVKIARRSDAIILVLGENEMICREAWNEDHLGDRDNLDLVGKQKDLT